MNIGHYFCRMQAEDRMRGNRSIALAWKKEWADRRFRVTTIIGSVLMIVILASFPVFFNWIEQRTGAVITDHVLGYLPAVDVSIPTFLIIWSMTILLCIRCVQDPEIFILFLVCFVLLCFSRILTITLVPLEPPAGLIPLKDPLSSIFYGGTDVFIKKDLFYSGHTSIQLLMFFTLKGKTDKLLALLSSIAIGILVLVQHVHYTIDVIAAIIFCYGIYRLGLVITGVRRNSKFKIQNSK
jgi:hypothetical protein